MRSLERKLEKANLSWSAAKTLLQTHCYSTIFLPTKDGTVYKIRKPGIPDEKQRSIYQLLKIDCSHLPIFKEILKRE